MWFIFIVVTVWFEIWESVGVGGSEKFVSESVRVCGVSPCVVVGVCGCLSVCVPVRLRAGTCVGVRASLREFVCTLMRVQETSMSAPASVYCLCVCGQFISITLIFPSKLEDVSAR